MTVNGVHVSSLRAAREWRGVSLVVAARNSGLGVLQAEALEDGRIDRFSSVDEMVAAAVLYGSSLGIGRDEAMALLDRAMHHTDSQAAHDGTVSMQHGSTSDFSAAVKSRTASRPAVLAAIELSALVTDIEEPAPASIDETGEIPVSPEAGSLPDADQSGSADETIDESVAAALDLDTGYRAAWEQAQSEFAAWESMRISSLPPGGGITGRVEPAFIKVFGESRGATVVKHLTRAEISVRNAGRATREWLRRSEHATLIVAIAVGIVLIALLVGVAGALQSHNAPSAKPAHESPAIVAPGSPDITDGTPRGDTTDKPAASHPAEAEPAAPTVVRMLAPSQIRLQVLNSGRQKGYARQIADGLLARGYKIDAVGNSKTAYGSSMILYPKQLEREAMRLSKQSGITTMDVLPAGRANGATMVVVVH